MKKIILNVLKITSALIIGALLFYLTFKNINFAGVLKRILTSDLRYIVAGFFIHSFSYFIIGIRWRILLGRGMGFGRLSTAVMTGYLFNLILFRIGDVLKCFLIKDKYSLHDAGASAVSEKIMDSTVVISFVFIPVFFTSHLSSLVKNVILIPVAILFSVIVFIVISAFFAPVEKAALSLIKKLPFHEKLSVFYTGFNGKIKSLLKEPLKLIWAFIITVTLWGVYTLFFYLTVYAVGLKASPVDMMFITGVTTIGMNIPVSVGFIGTFHYSFYLAAIKTGVPPEVASAAGIVLHFSKISAHGLMGIIGLSFQKLPSFKELRNKKEV